MDEQLGSVLAVLTARTGAQAVRVVDARSGEVLAQTGVIPAADVAALVALARDAAPGPDDLVLPTHDGVHVLRSFSVAFLHLRVAPGPGVVAARRELASPELRRAVDGAVDGAVRGITPGVDGEVTPLPEPRRPRPPSPWPGGAPAGPPPAGPARGRHARPGPPVRQPALAALGPAAAPTERAGPLAVLALAPTDGRTPAPLPHRAAATPTTMPQPMAGRPPLSLPEVLRQEWAVDPATMARMLHGLRRLN